MASRQGKATKAKKSRSVTFATARAIALALPGVEVSSSWGLPALKVGGKLLFLLKEDDETLVLRIGLRDRAAIMAAKPQTFYITPHHENYPAVLVRLSKVTRADLQELIENAWEMQAPKRIRKQRP